MKTIRRTLFAHSVMALGISLITVMNVHASATKVGNGDDGADLEALSPIKSGPIVRSRQRAVETLKQLNVTGVPGLGLLIPELERTELLMASKDSHPTGEKAGSLEVSEDKRLVYARTFTEPYAATRFFPAAQKLTTDQLVALHIHEALHRSLPREIRANEDAVMHLTMAMTSPGVSYDRIRQVASLYLPTSNVADLRGPSSESITALVTQPLAVPAKSPTTVGYDFEASTDDKYSLNGIEQLQGLQFTTSITGYKNLAGYSVEPVFRARVKISENSGRSFVGPSSYDLQGQVQIDEHTFSGPLVRFTAKSLDESLQYSNDRDVFTLGAFYRTDFDQAYFDSTLTYSFPSSTHYQDLDTNYKSILSIAGRTGFKWGRFFLGGIAEVHASEGTESTRSRMNGYDLGESYPAPSLNSYRLLVAGPELGFATNRYQFRLYSKWVMNNTQASLTDLGDIVDRGSGRGSLGTSLSMQF
jgi:hypothetical protein